MRINTGWGKNIEVFNIPAAFKIASLFLPHSVVTMLAKYSVKQIQIYIAPLFISQYFEGTFLKLRSCVL
jgi:hypothetical protein